MKHLLAILLLLIASSALAADLAGEATAEVGEVVWLEVAGEPAFAADKTVAENLDAFRAWLSTTRFQVSSPDNATPTLEPDVQIRFSFTDSALVWDLKAKFVAPQPGVYVVAALLDSELTLHRIQVGPITPPDPTPPDPPNPPQPPAPGKVTAATWVYEKDQGAVPRHVLAAFQRINESGIRATTFEEDTVDGDGQVPDQYQAALEAARKAGLPALVIQSEDTVVRVLRNPETLEQVLEAVQ